MEIFFPIFLINSWSNVLLSKQNIVWNNQKVENLRVWKISIISLKSLSFNNLQQIFHMPLGGSLRDGHQANLPTVRMILPTWFDHLHVHEKKFSSKGSAGLWKPVPSCWQLKWNPWCNSVMLILFLDTSTSHSALELVAEVAVCRAVVLKKT